MYPKRTRNLLLLISAALLLFAGCDLGSNPQSGYPLGDQNPQLASPTPYAYTIADDLRYIDLMVPHHQLAVDMAELADEKAQHGELKGLARDIILSQRDEISRMLIWKGQLSASTTPLPWHISGQGTQAPHDGGHGGVGVMPGMDVDLDALGASPTFDRDFIVAMIPHHQSAIDMSRAALPNLKKREVHDLAQDIITVQQIEIDRMEGWLREWFGQSPP